MVKKLKEESSNFYTADNKKIIPTVFEVYNDMTGINDSLELESGTRICYMETNVGSVEIRVVGEVRLFFDEYGTGSFLLYTDYYDFPDKLKKMIHDGTIWTSWEVEIDSHNRFEAVSDNGESDIADIECMTDSELKEECLGFVKYFYNRQNGYDY